MLIKKFREPVFKEDVKELLHLLSNQLMIISYENNKDEDFKSEGINNSLKKITKAIYKLQVDHILQ